MRYYTRQKRAEQRRGERRRNKTLTPAQLLRFFGFMSGGSVVSCSNSGGGGEKDVEQEEENAKEKKLRKGQRVEVSSNEEGFKGAWFVGTVVDTESDKYLVQYETLLAEDGSRPLKEYITTPFIRPLPPSPPPTQSSSSSSFEINDLVDAFHRDAWWAGVISRVLDDRINYVVSFQNPPEDITFNASSLRFHLEWLDGKWIRPPQVQVKGQKVGAVDTEKVKQSRGRRAKKSEVQKFGASATGGKKSNARGGSEEIMDIDKDTKELQDENPSVPPEDHHHQQQQLVISEIQINGENNRPNGGEDNQKRKRGRPFKSLTGQINEKRKMGRPPLKSPTGQSSEKRKMGRPPLKSPTGRSIEKKKMGRPPLKSPTGQSSEKRKMGRPPVKSPTGQSSEKKMGRPPVESPTGHSSEIRKRGRPPLKSPTGQSVEIRKRGRPFKRPINSVKRAKVSAKDSSDASTGDEASHSKTRDVAKINDEMPSDIFSGFPTLSAEEGISSQTIMNDLRVSPGLCALINQGAVDRQNANDIVARDDEFVDSQRCWPFDKCSPLWTTIESMQVFQKAPQKPHFSSLSKCEEQFREGLAIGCMVTFASTVDRISKLQISDPTSVIDRYLETLVELEYHGFNVEPFRACLNELLAKKARESQLQDESKQVVSEIAGRHLEKTRLENEIHEIEAKIREHQQKYGASTKKKELMDQEIATLESKKNQIIEDMTSVRLDFQKIVASPL